MNEKESKIKKWFDMWLDGSCEGIDDLFCTDAVYTECWGPKYAGLSKIKHWFEEWNTRGKVCAWDIKQFFHKGEQSIAEWYFSNVMNDGREEKFDGVSVIVWRDEKIALLKEFGCSINNYDPYKEGDEPVFRNEKRNLF